MSEELADRVDGDLSASDETRDRARLARTRAAALDVDWESALAVYRTRANQDPKSLVHFPDFDALFEDVGPDRCEVLDESSNDDERHEPAASR